MLVQPRTDDYIAALMSHDPGTDTFGIATFFFDVRSLDIISCVAETIHGSKLSKNALWEKEIELDRYSRIYAIERELLKRYQEIRPLIIVSEAPFVKKRFPQAGMILTEMICGIRNAVRAYDVWKPLYLIEPTVAKSAVGAVGKGKQPVNDALVKLKDLNYTGIVPLNQLDEHSTDALAVGYAKLRQLRESR